MYTPQAAFMHRCLELATLGRRSVGNGAMVGAVLVREEKIIAEGYHAGFGEPHAEAMLLQTYMGEIQQQDVLYVNLEPCSHEGKTPPCVDHILRRGVRHLVYGMMDPDPRNQGKGIKVLQDNGVEVAGPFLRAECERLNRGFSTLRTRGRPWITLKKAQMQDGRIANADGSPLKITSKDQDIFSHTFVRAQADAILVGSQTIQNDDPRLDTRFAQKNDVYLKSDLTENKKVKYKKCDQEEPFRIILDPHFRIPVTSRVLTDDLCTRTIVIVNAAIKDPDALEKEKVLTARGVRVGRVVMSENFFIWKDLFAYLSTPFEEFAGITSILVEGGARTWNTFRLAAMFDEEIIEIGSSVAP